MADSGAPHSAPAADSGAPAHSTSTGVVGSDSDSSKAPAVLVTG
jgi:hypothetical protein